MTLAGGVSRTDNEPIVVTAPPVEGEPGFATYPTLAVDEVEILTDYYEVIMSSHYRHEIDLTDPVITALIAAADA